MDLTHAVLLVGAGFAAGTVNAVAGGGSLVTFPTLLAVGLPPIAANVTNSVAVVPGYLASAYGSRTELRELAGRRGRRALLALAPTAAAGAALGCALLLNTPRRVFDLVVPLLVLGATLALAFQGRLRRLVGDPRERTRNGNAVRLHTVVGLVAIYGGYFNAALGVMLVAALGLVLHETIARVGALKNATSTVIGVVAASGYALFGPVNWAAVAVVTPATLLGGYAGARLARRLPAAVLRGVIVAFGTIVGVVLLLRAL